MTNTNETGCLVGPQDATKCKCTHEVPDSMIARLPRDEFTTRRKVRRAASKKAKDKKKAAKSKTGKKKVTR